MNTRKHRQAQELAEFLEGLAWVCWAYPRPARVTLADVVLTAAA